MTIDEAIDQADRVLQRIASNRSEIDAQWKAVINLIDFIVTDPDRIWTFISKWGRSDHEYQRSAIATCLLERLLERHFDRFFNAVKIAVKSDERFAHTFARCSKFGQSKLGVNAVHFDALRKEAELREDDSRIDDWWNAP
jgi:hypothetical protein